MNKLLIIPILAVLTIGVSQDLTTDEQRFIDLLGAGEDVTLTEGQGISIWNGEKYIPLAYGEKISIDSPFTPDTVGPENCLLTSNAIDLKLSCLFKKVLETTEDGELILEADDTYQCKDIGYVYNPPTEQFPKGTCTTEEIRETQAIADYEAQQDALIEATGTFEVDVIIINEDADGVITLTVETEIRDDPTKCYDYSPTHTTQQPDEIETRIMIDPNTGQPIEELVFHPVVTDRIDRNDPEFKIRKQVQACDGWQHTYKDHYVGMIVNEIPFNHKDIAVDTKTWSQDGVNEVSNFGKEKYNQNSMCTSHNSDSTKRQYGCVIEKNYDPATLETPVMSEFLDWHDVDLQAQLPDILNKIRADVIDRHLGGQYKD